ncbi:tRNA pseudouridine(55) synthase TruB [Pseudomonadota bacterium]
MEKTLKKDFRGIVGVHKPKGMTSHDVVNVVRRITGERRVGHAGTLDPLAEGVLVVGIGREFTKKLSVEVKKEKEYVAEVMLGATSSTDDSEGEIKKFVNFQIPIFKDMAYSIKKFEGEIWQTPPLYSAVKVKGKEAYKYARRGKEVKLEPRKREVKEIEIIDYMWPVLKLRIVTGAGVYIRSIARDLGEKLGVGGYLKSLVRTRVGNFEISDCVNLD